MTQNGRLNVTLQQLQGFTILEIMILLNKKWKYPETSKEIYNRFGILNLFSPYKCTGSYRLDLQVFEERIVCEMLFDLAKIEGLQYLTNVILDGNSVEVVDKEFVDNLPLTGIFEGSYVAPEDAVDEECRDKIGKKYLGWTSADV